MDTVPTSLEKMYMKATGCCNNVMLLLLWLFSLCGDWTQITHTFRTRRSFYDHRFQPVGFVGEDCKAQGGKAPVRLLSSLVALRSWGEPENLTVVLSLSTTPQHFWFVPSTDNRSDLALPFWHHKDSRYMLLGLQLLQSHSWLDQSIVAIFHYALESFSFFFFGCVVRLVES